MNLLILATGSSYNACLAAKPALESYGDLTVDIQEPFYFSIMENFLLQSIL